MLKPNLLVFLVGTSLLLGIIPETNAFFNRLTNLFNRDCKNQCTGRQRIVRNSNYTFVQNGCVEFNLTDVYAGSTKNWTTCCNFLSGCFQNCGSIKRVCDELFERCLKLVVRENPSLNTASTTTRRRGRRRESNSNGKSEEKRAAENLAENIQKNNCDIFKNYQLQACICQ